MISLKITATTPHGVVLSRPWGIALDGLLASVLWHRHKLQAAETGQPITYHPTAIPEQLALPLAICGDPRRNDWHWMATFADLHPRMNDSDIRWRTSRTDRARLQHLTASIGSQAVSDSSGRYQRRVVPVIAHPCTHVTWRAVGDPERITNLLTELSSIGKHRSVGEGLVTQWSILPTPEVPLWSAGHEHETGELGRTLPPRCCNDYPFALGTPGVSTLRPPYLHPESRQAAYYPTR